MNSCTHLSGTLPHSSAQVKDWGPPVADPQLQAVSALGRIWDIPIHKFSDGI